VIKPAAVKRGSRVAVVSPASPFSREEFASGVNELRRLGYEPTYDDDVFARSGTYLSGTPALRAAAFSRAWADPSVAALIAVRGGYGSVQLLPLLDEKVIRRTPKLFIGYSDNTSLLSWLTCRCGITALHGPMIEGRLAKGPEGFDADSMLAFMQDGEGRSCRAAVRRHHHAAGRIARHAVRVRPSRWLRVVPRGRQ
jgi:muramoyltetrapeptide carboxypeptidase